MALPGGDCLVGQVIGPGLGVAGRWESSPGDICGRSPARVKEMTLPSISIVTPSYNQKKFLEQTIVSVISQRYANLEYIVMDGGSTDGSIEVLRKYGDDISFWTSEKDNGQSDAIRRGFTRAQGEILAWLNSDDTYEPSALKTVGEFFAANPGIELVYGNLNFIDEDGKRLFTAYPVLDPGILLYENQFIPQQAMFWRRTLYERSGGVNPDLRFAMDFELIVKFLKKGARAAKVRNTLANFRVHAAAKSSTIRDVMHAELVETISRYYPEAMSERAWVRSAKKFWFRGLRFLKEPRSFVSAVQSRL